MPVRQIELVEDSPIRLAGILWGLYPHNVTAWNGLAIKLLTLTSYDAVKKEMLRHNFQAAHVPVVAQFLRYRGKL